MAHAYFFEVNDIFYNITSTENLTIEVTYKDSRYNSYSGNVIIPETVTNKGKTYRVTSIGEKAFYKCTELTNVTLPNSIVTIGTYAFFKCSKLTDITIPNNVTNINGSSFAYCESITSITIPSSVTYIGGFVFHNCTSLKDLRIDDGETTLEFEVYNDNYAPFYHSPLENVYLGRNVKGNGSHSSYLCYDKPLLTSLTIGDNITNINSYTFYQCSSLTNVIIPNNVTSIESNAFTGCTNLKDIYYISTTPPTSLWLTENTYVPNKEAYSKSSVSGGSGNLIEYITFNNSTFTYGETPDTSFVNNLENKGYTTNASIPELPRNAGTHTIEIPFTFSKNGENINVNIPYTYTVNKATLIVKADTITRLYGDNNPELRISYSGFVYGENENVLTNKGTTTTSATVQSNVGEYSITVSDVTADNYEIQYKTGTLHINKAPLTIISNNYTRLYGDINPEFKYSYNGAKNNDDENTIFETRPTMSCDANEKSGAGEYEIIINGATSNNYEITYKTGVLSINKREITVSTKNYTRKYGEENPEFEISYNGFVNNEDESALLIKPKAKTIAEKNSDVGTYEIYIGGGDAENYLFAYNKGTLSIEKANQTITWNQDFNDLKIGSQVELTATASSGLDIEYIIPDNNFISVYTIEGTTYLDCYGPGEIAIRATQNGNKNYNAAVKVSKVIKVESTSSAISDIFIDFQVIINNNNITLTGANNNNVVIYNINGLLIKSIEQYTDEKITLDKGIYIVRVGNETIKIKL